MPAGRQAWLHLNTICSVELGIADASYLCYNHLAHKSPTHSMAPPKYEQIPQGDGGRDDSGFDDVEHFFSSAGQPDATASNANSGGDSQYPPAGYTSSELATAAMTDATASTSGKRTNVIYTFTPRYPIPGTTQSAMGILAPDRLVSGLLLQGERSGYIARSLTW